MFCGNKTDSPRLGHICVYIYCVCTCSCHCCITLTNAYRFPIPDLREGVAVKMYNHPKLRQEVCYADVSSLLLKTCLKDSNLTKYEVELKTLKGNVMNLVIFAKYTSECCVYVTVCG